MRLKSKPRKPKRKKRTIKFNCAEYSLDEIVTEMRRLMEIHNYDEDEIEQLLTLKNISVERDWDYDDYDVYAVLSILESNDDFVVSTILYQSKLKEYNEWYEDNKDEIEAEKKKREEESSAEEAEKIRKQMEKLKKRLEKVEA